MWLMQEDRKQKPIYCLSMKASRWSWKDYFTYYRFDSTKHTNNLQLSHSRRVSFFEIFTIIPASTHDTIENYGEMALT